MRSVMKKFVIKIFLAFGIIAVDIDYTRLRGHKLTIYPVRWRLCLPHGVNYLLLLCIMKPQMNADGRR